MTRRKKTTPKHPEVALIHKLIRKSFDGSLDKTSQWFFQPLELLSEKITPNEMIMVGRHRELLDYVLDLTGTMNPETFKLHLEEILSSDDYESLTEKE